MNSWRKTPTRNVPTVIISQDNLVHAYREPHGEHYSVTLCGFRFQVPTTIKFSALDEVTCSACRYRWARGS